MDTFYLCDPSKNIECSKRGCAHNPNSKYPRCCMTMKKECSTDGKKYRFNEKTMEYEKVCSHE